MLSAGDNISTGPSINDPFYNRGYLFEAPVFSGYGDFRHVEFTKVGWLLLFNLWHQILVLALACLQCGDAQL